MTSRFPKAALRNNTIPSPIADEGHGNDVPWRMRVIATPSPGG